LTSPTRDLASPVVWERSLERSQRRRVLAEDARRTIARRKHASLAVSAAMAATPVIPSVISSAMSGGKKGASDTRKLSHETQTNRVLLKLGAVSPSVAEVQRELNIPDDGYFGPVTQKAVKKFQKKHHLAATGKVDIKTWLKLFPDGMIFYAPGTGLAQLATHAPAGALAGSGQASDAGLTAASSDAMADTKAGKKHAAKLKKAGGAPDAASADAGILPDVGSDAGSGSSDGGPSGGASVGAPPSTGSGGGGGDGGGGGGPAIIPRGPFTSASEMVAAMIAAANKIDSKHYSYRWGGGHNGSFSGPYDCSGAVSAVLHAAGLLTRPMVSGEFAHWGRPGRGVVTIYANAGHVYMSIKGRYFGTTHANPGGGAGWFNGGPRPGFVVVHVPFERMKFASKRLAKMSKASKRKRHVAKQRPRDEQYHSVTPGYSGQAPGAAEASGSGAGTASDGSAQTGTQQPAYDGTAAAAPATAAAQQGPGVADEAYSGGSGSAGSAAATATQATAPAAAPAAGASSGVSDGSLSSSYSGSGSSGASSGAGSSGVSDESTTSSGSSAGSSSGSSASAGSSGSGQSSSAPAASGVSDEQQSAGSTASSAASSAGSTASSASGSAGSAAGSASGSSDSGSSSGSTESSGSAG
jgi:hypothetical protein